MSLKQRLEALERITKPTAQHFIIVRPNEDREDEIAEAIQKYGEENVTIVRINIVGQIPPLGS